MIQPFATLKRILNHPVNRGGEKSAILRYLSWQIGSRLLKKPILIEWVSGAKFLAETGEVGLTGNIYMGLYEFHDMCFVLHFLRSNDLFVDVGANSGAYSILASAAVGASVCAFEPSKESFLRLARNCSINDARERVILINKAVGSKSGKVKFSKNLDSNNHVVFDSKGALEEVQLTTLDGTLNRHSPSIIKIDVEGYEMEVLKGAEKTLQNPKLNAVIVEINGNFNKYGFTENDILSKMHSFGFEPHSYNPQSRTLVELSGKNKESLNTLFIRDREFVSSRTGSAELISIHDKKY